jgi:hypothetical protein
MKIASLSDAQAAGIVLADPCHATFWAGCSARTCIRDSAAIAPVVVLSLTLCGFSKASELPIVLVKAAVF